MTLALEVLSDYCCDLMRFNYFSNRIAKFSNQIANRIAMFQIISFHLKSNHQNGSNRDLNPIRDLDLPITGYCYYCCNLQTKLHGSAGAKVLSVGEKQPPLQEIWTQKVSVTGMVLFL